MSSNTKTFLFAAILCLACSYLLTFAATYLKPFQEANVRADKQKNVMKVLNLLDAGKKYSNSEILDLFKENVKSFYVTDSGELLSEEQDGTFPIYLKIKNNQIQSYAIPISGYGLWSTLYGFFSLEADGNTVAGITFYAHGETPGLGAECEKPWFQNNFLGKKITNKDGDFVSIGIAKSAIPLDTSSEKKQSMVDGISGATITAKGIEKFLLTDLKKYEPFSKRLRNGERISIGG